MHQRGATGTNLKSSDDPRDRQASSTHSYESEAFVASCFLGCCCSINQTKVANPPESYKSLSGPPGPK